jgi:hypothetical protein
MKRKLMAITVVLVSLGVGSVALAQGRHDEKPHNVANTENTAKDKAPAVASSGVGGRHDEKPHGMKKAKPKAKPANDQPTLASPAPAEAKATAK